MARITVELDNETLFEALEENQFLEYEVIRILKILFPQRGYCNKKRLTEDISLFIDNNML